MAIAFSRPPVVTASSSSTDIHSQRRLVRLAREERPLLPHARPRLVVGHALLQEAVQRASDVWFCACSSAWWSCPRRSSSQYIRGRCFLPVPLDLQAEQPQVVLGFFLL